VARRRLALGIGAVLLVAGSNATTQVFKELIYRPHIGVDVDRVAAGNSLPSGHTTVAASVAVALLLVVPAKTRAAVALAGAVVCTLVGVATLSAGWHRPSDAVAALLIVGGWAALGGLVLLLGQRVEPPVDGPVVVARRTNALAAACLALIGVFALAVAFGALSWVDPALVDPPEEMTRRQLFLAYAGSAAGITGTAALVMAAVLATAHRIVPPRPEPAAAPAALATAAA
jgi:hypothetical protein